MNACHMCCGLKNSCSTARAPGASRKIATRAPSTTRVLTVEMTVPLRPPSSLAPRPLRANDPGGGFPAEPAGGDPAEPGGGLPLSATGTQGWMVGNVR